MSRDQTASAGFTLIELTITIPLFIGIIGVLIGFLVSLYAGLLQKNAGAELALEAQQTLTAIQDDLYFARNFAEAPSAVMVDDDGPGGAASGWTYNTSPNNTLIVYEIALDKVRQDPDREIVYQKAAASGNSCAADDIELNPPVLNNLIYYVQNGTSLRRRVLVPDPVNDRCSEPVRTQSCDTAKNRTKQTDGGDETVSCPADTTLTNNVSSFQIDYYDADNNLIDMSDDGSPLQAEKITVKLSLEKTIFGKTQQHSSQLTITKINGGDPDIQ
jgi:type II secretory pathway pseudopilin PulG